MIPFLALSSAFAQTPTAPKISNLPTTLTLDYGAPLSLYPEITGTEPITFQWKLNDIALTSTGPTGDALPANTSWWHRDHVTEHDAGYYILTATNQAGSTTSAPVTVFVNPAVAPVIGQLSGPLTFDYGTSFFLVMNATGSEPMSYRWTKDGVDLPSNIYGTAAVYIDYATTANSGDYIMMAENPAGIAISIPVSVTINPAAGPTITEQPTPLNITQGFTANFNVSAIGTNPIAYQWYFGGQVVPGATNDRLTIPNVQSANTGDYTVVLTNPGGLNTSNTASLSISPALGVVSVSAGQSSSMFVRSGGSLWAMGTNATGLLGDGTNTNRLNPILIATDVVCASTGEYHSLFIKADGTLWTMGSNRHGALGDGTTTDRNSPIQIATEVVSASVGDKHSLFLKADGSLWATGGNDYGQLGDGTINDHDSPVKIAVDVQAVTAGGAHSFFIKSDGSLWGMGSNNYGELGDGSYDQRNTPVHIDNGVVAVTAGIWHSLYLKADGSLWGMGNNGSGPLGDGTYINSPNPIQIATGVEGVEAGFDHSLFVKSDHTLWVTGANHSGQLGIGSFAQKIQTPIQIADKVHSASGGGTQSFFIKSDGALWGMGGNYWGGLGDGTTDPQIVPKQIVDGQLSSPVAPTGMVATSGELEKQIRLNWHPTINATSYEVWRNTTNDPDSATRIATAVPISLYYDLTAALTTTYYYWVKAVNPAGASGFSAVAPLIPILPPSNAVITITVE